MPLETELAVAQILERSYHVTVPQNAPKVTIPNSTSSVFPKLVAISDDFVI
jgi:hypothetical protein